MVTNLSPKKPHFVLQAMGSTKAIIGRMIKSVRTEKKITQQQLADKLGVDRQYIWRIENGKINFTLDYLDKILNELNHVIHFSN